MRSEAIEALRNLPDVHVVNIQHVRKFVQHMGLERRHVDRRAFHQHMQRIAQQRPRPLQDNDGNDQREQRIDDLPAGVVDDDEADDDGDRL